MFLLLALLAAGDSTRTVRDSLPHVHRISLESGYGYETVMWRIGAQHDFRRRAFQEGRLAGSVFVEITAGGWYGRAGVGENRDIFDLGVTPVWRLARTTSRRIEPYVEAAVGFHHISETRINRRVGFGTAFQFGDHAGFGARFGSRARYDLTFRFQHLSNGGVRRPNHGINFSSLRFSVRL